MDRKNKGKFTNHPLFLIFVFVILLAGCGPEDSAVPANDHQYIPLRKGWYQIYDVEETVYQLGNAQSTSYQLKTVVADSFLNAESNYTYVIHRTRKYEGADEWVQEETWTARLTGKEAIVTEGSTPYVVLTFPAARGNEWNGNAYNSEINPNTNTGLDLYEVEEKGVACAFNNLQFEDCLNVIQEDNGETIVFQDRRREIYSRNVGLVRKEVTQLRYCTDEDRNCIGQQIIDEGIIYTQQISEYGLE